MASTASGHGAPVAPPPVGPQLRAGRSISKVVPFWVLQAAEIALLVAMVDLSFHVHNGIVLVVAGAAFALAAMTADGPLGVVRLCSRRVHVKVVVAIAILVTLVPVVPLLRPDVSGIVILVFSAVGVFRLATLTSTERPAPARRAAPTTVQPGPEPTVTAVPDRPTSPRPGGAARRAGQVAATAVVAASQHRPALEHRTRQSIRAAGRSVGRLRTGLGRPKSGSGAPGV